MPAYAVLGATGNTGQSLLSVLLESPENEVHAYVRSKSKLLRLSPHVADNTSVTIYEGQLDDVEVIKNCIVSTHAVFLVVAVSDNIPNCTVAQETATTVIAALERIRQENPLANLPRLVVLGASAMDPQFNHNIPSFPRAILLRAEHYVYEDLKKAEAYLRSHSDLVSSTFVKPGGLVHDQRKGHQLSTDRQQTFLSFLDLAAGMIEVADTDGETWDMKSVSVLPTGKNVMIEWRVPFHLLRGLARYYFPQLYRNSNH